MTSTSTFYRKKLIEVSLPLDVINREALRGKSIRHGHPSSLHFWWARRPLAACRAVLFAQLVDDPSAWPERFKTEEAQEAERQRLHRLIEKMVPWEAATNESILNEARFEIARSLAWNRGEEPPSPKDPKAVSVYLKAHAPPVIDPFCGGGSIPLEAQRLGLEAHGSDLNPVPVLITKALIEFPPMFAGKPPVNTGSRKDKLYSAAGSGAEGLAADIRWYGKWMCDEAEKRIGQLYPKVKVTAEMAKGRDDLKPYVGDELTVIAWLWARTVPSPNPALKGAPVPLVRSFWLSKKKGKEAWIEPIIEGKESGVYRFEVRVGSPVIEKKGSIDAGTKTGRGAKFRCIITDTPIPDKDIKTAGINGRLGARLMAIVAEGRRGRVYLSPISEHECAARIDAAKRIDGLDAPLANDPRNIWCVNYGLDQFWKLFTPRQLVALTTFSDLVKEARERVFSDARAADTFPRDDGRLAEGGLGSAAYADAVAVYLAFLVDQLANHQSTICGWNSVNAQMRTVFARQAIPMTWDYAESNVFCESSGSFASLFDRLVKGVAGLRPERVGFARVADARNCGDGLECPAIYSTDPPYYDNIAYSDLSDFFYVWMKRSLSAVLPNLFTTLLTPKATELIASPYRFEGDGDAARRFFERGFAMCFDGMRRASDSGFPITVFYAFKQSENDNDDDGDDDDDEIGSGVSSTGWETMLQGLIGCGLSVLSTWPLRTEKKGRVIGIGTNALASSVAIACRTRDINAAISTRKEFASLLRSQLPPAVACLRSSSIAPVDLAQAAVGPGMAIYSRFSKVLESDGTAMSVRTALQMINKALDEVLTEQEGEFDADTGWAVAWFEQHGHDEGAFGVADTLARAKGVAVGGLDEAGIVDAKRGKVRLLRRDELPSDWDPRTDTRLTIWEMTQHLIRRLESGEQKAADLLKVLGASAEAARDLAYRLYTTCERKKWASEARGYNALVVAWPELLKRAAGEDRSERRLFEQT